MILFPWHQVLKCILSQSTVPFNDQTGNFPTFPTIGLISHTGQTTKLCQPQSCPVCMERLIPKTWMCKYLYSLISVISISERLLQMKWNSGKMQVASNLVYCGRLSLKQDSAIGQHNPQAEILTNMNFISEQTYQNTWNRKHGNCFWPVNYI